MLFTDKEQYVCIAINYIYMHANSCQLKIELDKNKLKQIKKYFQIINISHKYIHNVGISKNPARQSRWSFP